jgi:hypothetical protein
MRIYPPHTYPSYAVKEFINGTNADTWLIAYAKAKEYLLVTQELPKRSGKSKDNKKIKIPDACKESGLNVECINLFQMLKELGERFKQFLCWQVYFSSAYVNPLAWRSS